MDTTQDYQLTKADRNRISRDRTKLLQKTLTDLMMLSLTYALNYIELVAVQNPEGLAKEFTNSFEPYEWTRKVIEILAEGRGGFFEGMDCRYLGFERKDLFQCLSPEVQEKLRLQGVWFELTPPSSHNV